MRTSLVLSQDIVSTPRADFDRRIIENDRDSITDILINVGKTLFEGLKRGLVIERGMFTDIVVKINKTQSFLQ